MRSTLACDLIFIHVPKCGGRSINDLVTSFLNSNRFSKLTIHGSHIYDNLALKNLQDRITEVPYSHVNLIHGHIPINVVERCFNPQTIVTIVRDPIKRFISNLFHGINGRDINEIETRLSTDDIHVQDNLITRMWCGKSNANKPIGSRELETAYENLTKSHVRIFSFEDVVASLPEDYDVMVGTSQMLRDTRGSYDAANLAERYYAVARERNFYDCELFERVQSLCIAGSFGKFLAGVPFNQTCNYNFEVNDLRNSLTISSLVT
tara:strand:- start:502 stop:1293 length:792 start_codon:yes stop_codon:yes gene_type:complete